MKPPIDPLELTDEVEARYRRYLETTFHFRDPDLRRSFQVALEEGHLRKGPYVEATRAFDYGMELGELLDDLGLEVDVHTRSSLQASRRLFGHQERAIRNLLSGRNSVVATGTGSGKTEVFLYSILLHLYEQFRQSALGPGVRALVLYPMNALANDQRDRLGSLFRDLVRSGSDFRFTFGQYIGDTPNDSKDSIRGARRILRDSEMAGFRGDGGDAGELVFRSEMRDSPPHILLTNYSMLEYLLLRPLDSPLFDHGKARDWRFLVLDEAHQYRGTGGMEMAMLIRRLKQRLLEGGRADGFTCIATSATLTGHEEGPEPAAEFAGALFGEPFGEGDIVTADEQRLPQGRDTTVSADKLAALSNADQKDADEILRTVASEVNETIPADEPYERALGRLLGDDPRVIQFRKVLGNHPLEFAPLADEVFPEVANKGRRLSLLSGLVSLVVTAEHPATGGPLVSVRYHLFLRALEGAYVRLHPAKSVSLERRSGESKEGAYFEVALCRDCGQHYLVGKRNQKSGKLKEPIRDWGDPGFGASFFRPIGGVGEPPANGDEEANGQGLVDLELCVVCGLLGTTTDCGHKMPISVRREKSASHKDQPDQVVRCGACGYHASGRDPVREIVHGSDGPHAVIATALFNKLPQGRRKILAFADGRQEAAFFAWYLQSSYEDLAVRSLVLRVVRDLGGHAKDGLSIDELGNNLADLIRKEGLIDQSVGEIEAKQRAWTAVYREFALLQPRLSLEGVGLTRWTLVWPPDVVVPHVLLERPWNLDVVGARSVATELLSSLRRGPALDLRSPAAVPLHWSDVFGERRQIQFVLGPPGGQKTLRSWDGTRGSRSRYLEKLLDLGADSKEARSAIDEALRRIWETVTTDGGKGLLVPSGDGRVLNPAWWRVQDPGVLPDQCNICGRLQWNVVRGVCSWGQCQGGTAPSDPKMLERHHYRAVYQSELAPRLEVEEHTAQLNRGLAREFQRRFRSGDLHVLSSSTTFELGVDLGDLDAVFLRNVPPEAFNYVQRVGRAGRRRGYPGFAVTYCRRSSHDLHHFADPSRMLRGTSRAPVLRLSNSKIVGRHLVAVVLSEFFRANPERFANVESLANDFDHPAFTRDLAHFMESNRQVLSEKLRYVVPKDLHTSLGLVDDSWRTILMGPSGRSGGETAIQLAEAEVCGDYQSIAELETRAIGDRDYKTAEWARRRAETIGGEDVLSFLSRKAVIPKYGFPVDVVELDCRLSSGLGGGFQQVSLQRDLAIAISEFAPSSKLVANKKVWSSHALKRVVDKEWPQRRYHRCTEHNAYQQWEPGTETPDSPCGCQLPVLEYVIPQFGFTTSRKPPQEPTVRFSRLFTSRPYFAGPAGPPGEALGIPSENPVLSLRKASPGRMVVICEGRGGRGFYVCDSCGTGMPTLASAHTTPLGNKCTERVAQVSLAHEFVTDVLQLTLNIPGIVDGSVWAAYSTAFAVVEATAEVLEVPSADLSVTVRTAGTGSFPPIVLYDNVPGGAGLVAGLEDEIILKRCLEIAHERVGGRCGCDEASACYGCIRSYRNQFAHPYLRRVDAHVALTETLGRLRSQ